MYFTGILGRSWVTKTLCICVLLAVGAWVLEPIHNAHLHVPGDTTLARGLPFGLDLVILTGGFFLAGRFLRDRAVLFELRFLPIAVAMLSFGLVNFTKNANVSLAYRFYEPWLLTTIAAISGGFITVAIAKLITKLPALSRLFCYLGSSSLFILLFHFRIQEHLYKSLSLHYVWKSDLLAACFAFFICIALSLCVRAVVVRSAWLSLLYLPLKRGSQLRRASSTPIQ